MYGISADELHEKVVEELKHFCEHIKVDDEENYDIAIHGRKASEILESDEIRSFTQTIKLIIMKFYYKGKREK